MYQTINTRPIWFFRKTNPPVFIASALLMLAFIFFVTLFTERSKEFFSFIQSSIVENFSWVFTITTFGFLCFVLFLLFSKYGKIYLGQPGEKPEFNYPTWFAMMFSAGMGIGLVFWSIAEPIKHYLNPPINHAEMLKAANQAMSVTYFHWGLHAWSVFIVVGLSLAYFSFRKGLPLTIRSCFYPLLGDKIYGFWGHFIDVFAVVGTMFGIATSLGLGSMQVNSGLNFVGNVPETQNVQILLIALITACATASVVLGLEKGISRISNFNVCASTILVVFVLLLGPTLFIAEQFANNLKDYFSNIIYFSYWSEWVANTKWKSSWTIFYWGWWIAWAPFVGMFIARISKGRTIREFILGGLFVPTFATFLWLSTFGNTALHLEIFQAAPIAEAVSSNVSSALFKTLNQLPYAQITAGLSTLVIVTFFVTSSDSGSLVIDIMTAGGHPNPPVNQKVFWAITEGIIASVLVLAGGLKALQTAAIASGLPFALIMVGMCFTLFKELKFEYRRFNKT